MGIGLWLDFASIRRAGVGIILMCFSKDMMRMQRDNLITGCC
jgi:hypothetical protein